MFLQILCTGGLIANIVLVQRIVGIVLTTVNVLKSLVRQLANLDYIGGWHRIYKKHYLYNRGCAMKIIKKPKLSPTQFTCQACGCVYEAVYGEYTLFCDGLMHNYRGTVKQCKCPICENINHITDEFEEDKPDGTTTSD